MAKLENIHLMKYAGERTKEKTNDNKLFSKALLSLYIHLGERGGEGAVKRARTYTDVWVNTHAYKNTYEYLVGLVG